MGFAHVFLLLSDIADYAPEHVRAAAWNDPVVGIDWPLQAEPVLPAKDRVGVALGEAEVFG
jgi:dTDP-4-dehydrorhamnose 3,5-epimerase